MYFEQKGVVYAVYVQQQICFFALSYVYNLCVYYMQGDFTNLHVRHYVRVPDFFNLSCSLRSADFFNFNNESI